MVDLIGEILKRIKAAEFNTKEALASGTHIQTFEQYQRLLGTCEGLSQSLTLIEGILSEDDEDQNN
jgi:hypothetical protein